MSSIRVDAWEAMTSLASVTFSRMKLSMDAQMNFLASFSSRSGSSVDINFFSHLIALPCAIPRGRAEDRKDIWWEMWTVKWRERAVFGGVVYAWMTRFSVRRRERVRAIDPTRVRLRRWRANVRTEGCISRVAVVRDAGRAVG